MKKQKNNGFTLIEVLIVVIIVGIIAAIVIPHLSSGSEDAKLSSLVSDLRAIRSQIELYKMHHNSTLPGSYNGVTFVQALTGYTTVSGALAAVQAPAKGVYGPYLLKIPPNPFDNISTVHANIDEPDSSGGWHFNTITGKFSANDDGSSAGKSHTEY